MRKIIFDTETTGFSAHKGDKIVEIGAVELINDIPTGKFFHTYINPMRNVPIGAFQVHGLSEKFLKDKPVFGEEIVVDEMLDFFEDSILIAHNAKFDVGFVNAELKAINRDKLTNEIIDTLQLAKQKFPGAPASLDALCRRFSIMLDERKSQGHGALLDAKLLAKVYIELTGGLQKTLLEKNFSLPKANIISKIKIKSQDLVINKLMTKEKDKQFQMFVKKIKNNLWGD